MRGNSKAVCLLALILGLAMALPARADEEISYPRFDARLAPLCAPLRAKRTKNDQDAPPKTTRFPRRARRSGCAPMSGWASAGAALQAGIPPQ